MPESFKVLIKELQSLALDLKVLAEDKQEIKIRELDDEPGMPDPELKEDVTLTVEEEFPDAEEEEEDAEAFDFDDMGLDDDLLDDDF